MPILAASMRTRHSTSSDAESPATRVGTLSDDSWFGTRGGARICLESQQSRAARRPAPRLGIEGFK
jgi:hypothetical protein